MKVLKLIDPNAFEKFIIRRGNSMIIPVNDGAGNLVIGMECLDDPVFKDVIKDITSQLEESEYVPFPPDRDLMEQKFVEFDAANLVLKYDSDKEEVSRGDKVVDSKTGVVKDVTKQSDGITLPPKA